MIHLPTVGQLPQSLARDGMGACFTSELNATLETYCPSISSAEAGDTARTEMIECAHDFVAEVGATL